MVITTTDSDMAIIYANDAFSEMVGISREKLIAMPVRDVGLVRLDEVTRSQLRTAVENHQPS